MRRSIVALLAVSLTWLMQGGAEARVTFTVGDNVYADGQWFTVEEYEKYKAAHAEGQQAPASTTPATKQTQPQQQPMATAPATPAAASPAPSLAAAPTAIPQQSAMAPAALRAASCRTIRPYDEFPAEGDKFDCGPIGQLTRQEMLSQGWKIDFIEKLPAVTGQPAPNSYKLILSR